MGGRAFHPAGGTATFLHVAESAEKGEGDADPVVHVDGDFEPHDGKEDVGDTALDTPAYRATFMPITKDSTNEIKVDVLLEVR